MRKIIGLIFGSSVIAMAVGYILTNSTIFKICTHEEYDCRDLYNRIGDPLYYGMFFLVLIFIVLFIFPYTVKAWRNFALWFLPLAIDIFVTYTGPGRGYIDITPDSVTVFKWIGWVYVCISIAIIAFSVFNRKYGKEVTLKISSKRQKIIFWSLWVLYVAILIGLHFFD